MRVGGLLIGLILAMAITASPASAWYATGDHGYSGPEVVVHGLDGERHDVTATGLPGPNGVPEVYLDTAVPYADTVLIHDSAAPVTAPPAGEGAGCTVIDDHTERCHGFNYNNVDGTYSDGGAYFLTLNYQTSSQATVKIPADSAPMWLEAGTGSGNDSIEDDNLEGANAYTGDGNDKIVIRGGDGNGNEGFKYIDGGPGNDSLDVVNDRRDNVSCGDGNDTLRGDQSDASPDCESQQLFPTP